MELYIILKMYHHELVAYDCRHHWTIVIFHVVFSQQYYLLRFLLFPQVYMPEHTVLLYSGTIFPPDGPTSWANSCYGP